MAKSLIITEKPSVAQEFARILGVSGRNDGYIENDGYVITWCVGHLVSPMDAAGYDTSYKKWKYDDLPILPEPFRYVLAKGKEEALEMVRSLIDEMYRETGTFATAEYIENR